MVAKRAVSLVEVCYRRSGGLLRGGMRGPRVGEFIACWAVTQVKLGTDEPTMAEFVEDWRGAYSTATAYRRLEAFREMFPEFEWPHELTGPLVEAIRARGGEVGEPDAALLATPVLVAA